MEKTQKNNPHQLTIYQHVYPKACIDWFADLDGLIQLFDVTLGCKRSCKSSDKIFCARRVWDQRSESGYMKRIEDEFHELASLIRLDPFKSISPEEMGIINYFYALWLVRSECKNKKTQDHKFNLITGSGLSNDQEEVLEKSGVLYIRDGGIVPSRFLNGLQLQLMIDNHCKTLRSTNWKVIQSTGGDFIVPDSPTSLFIPIGPDLALIHADQGGLIDSKSIGNINKFHWDKAEKYIFSRDFHNCPGIVLG
jgi:hypothetical protein